jgi:hypothetical protein
VAGYDALEMRGVIPWLPDNLWFIVCSCLIQTPLDLGGLPNNSRPLRAGKRESHLSIFTRNRRPTNTDLY